MTTTTLHRAQTYRLYPTPEQASVLGSWVGAVRAVYNLGLEQRKMWSKSKKVSVNYYTQAKELPELRREFDWIKSVPSQPLQQALKDLDQSFRRYFDRISGYPKNRVRGRNDSMRFPTPSHCPMMRLGRRVGGIHIPKLGLVHFRWTKKISGEIRNITIKRHAGLWYIVVAYLTDIKTPETSTLSSVGLDRGVTHLAALSTGELISPQSAGKKILKKIKCAQRKLSRKTKKSKRYYKALLRVQKLHAKVARIRKDHAHKLSHSLAKNHGIVVMEQLNIQNMTRSAKGTLESPGSHIKQKSGLNRSILDRCWGMLETFLEYKLQARGGRIIKVQPHYTSQRCSHCGHIDKDSRNKEKFHCTSCHHEDHADLNAAINIHNLGLEFLSFEKKEKSRWDTPEYILRGEASVQTCLRSANHSKIKVTNL